MGSVGANAYAEASGGDGQMGVERGYGSFDRRGGQQDAAVREAKVRARSKGGESYRRILRECHCGHVQITQNGLHPLQLMSTSRADQHLRHGQRAHRELVVGHAQQEPCGPLVVRVAGIEMCDENTRVEDDHAGQSVRRSAR